MLVRARVVDVGSCVSFADAVVEKLFEFMTTFSLSCYSLAKAELDKEASARTMENAVRDSQRSPSEVVTANFLLSLCSIFHATMIKEI